MSKRSERRKKRIKIAKNNKNLKIEKKEKIHLSPQLKKRLIDKLNKMGLTDEIRFVPTGKFKPKQIYDKNTKQYKVVNAPILKAINPQRDMLKKMKYVSINEIKNFINTEFDSEKQQKEKLDESNS